MENVIGILVGAILILAVWLWIITKQLRKTEGSLQKAHQEAQMAIREITLIKGKLKQVQNIDLNLTSIEDEVEENTQQLASFVRQEIGGVDSDLRELVDQVDELKDLEERVIKLEEKIGAVDEE